MAMALRTYYPRENLLPNDKAIELWYMQLGDIPYDVAQAGLNKWVATNKWSPSIAEIREMAMDVIENDAPDWGDAWAEVNRAIRFFGMYRPDEALKSLSPLCRKAAERIGFQNLCLSENPSADRANFRMIYERIAEKNKQDAVIPTAVKLAIEEARRNHLALGSGQNEGMLTTDKPTD